MDIGDIVEQRAEPSEQERAGLVEAMDFDIVVNRFVADFTAVAEAAARFRDQAEARASTLG